MFKKISEALGIKQNILICCYGKLPIYKDFIFIGTDAREAYHFKEWMDKGFGGEWNENLSATSFSPHRILMTFPQQRNVVVASIWDSFDMGGLRRFPFAIFVMLPRNVFINSLSCFLPVWEYMEKCYSSMEEIKNISEFYNKYRGLTMEMNGINKNIFLKTLQDEKMKVLIDGLFKENNEECWANLLQDILTVFSLPQMLKNRDPEIALRLPLACLMNIPIQVESWMRFIKQNFPQPLPIPTLFFLNRMQLLLAFYGGLHDRKMCNCLVRILENMSTSLI